MRSYLDSAMRPIIGKSSHSYVPSGHQRWGEGAAESLNPDFTFKLTKNMVAGDSHCEWVVERKK